MDNKYLKIYLNKIEREILIDALRDATPNRYSYYESQEIENLYEKIKDANNLQMIKEYNLERRIVGQKENIVDVDGKIQEPSIEIKTLLDFLKKDKIDYFNFDNMQITINSSDLYKLIKFINKDYIFEIETELTMIISNKK